MFARFRQVRGRLNVSVVEATRTGARVYQRHIASLGSIAVRPSPADRVRFWISMDQRLARLSNRLDDEARDAILAAVHARIPIPTAEDQEAVRAGGRQANAPLFGVLRGKHRALADVYRREAERQAATAEAVDRLEAAYASRPMTPADARRFLRQIGWTAAELRRSRDLAALCQRWGEDQIIEMIAKEGMQAGNRAQSRAVRSLKRIAS